MLVKLLDTLYDTSDRLTQYMINTANPDVALIESTFSLLELQLKQIYKDSYKTIFDNDDLWNYYQAIVDNIMLLHDRVDRMKQLTNQEIHILYA